MKFTMYSDPSHAWLRVTEQDVRDIGLSIKDFTPYSYRSKDGKYWYLEEDLDATTFITIYEYMKGHPLQYKVSNTNGRSSIRSKFPLLDYSTWDRDAYYERRNVPLETTV